MRIENEELSEEKTRNGVPTTCTVCGKSFLSAYGKKRYCSKHCYYMKHREENISLAKAYYAAHRKELTTCMKFYALSMREKMETDSEFYAQYRFDRRIRQRLHYEKTHPGCRPYKPNKKKCIPDWAVKGQDVVDRGSVFLSGNMSDEQVMAANDFALQQNAGEERHRPKIKTVFRK